MKNNKKSMKIIIGGISKLDKDLPFADQSNTRGRCVEKLGEDFKTYSNDTHRCKACSILVDHWLNTEYKDKAFLL